MKSEISCLDKAESLQRKWSNIAGCQLYTVAQMGRGILANVETFTGALRIAHSVEHTSFKTVSIRRSRGSYPGTWDLFVI